MGGRGLGGAFAGGGGGHLPTSCQGVWIVSPSPQLRGPHTKMYGLQVYIPNPRGHTMRVCGLSVVFTL